MHSFINVVMFIYAEVRNMSKKKVKGALWNRNCKNFLGSYSVVIQVEM